MRFLIVDDEPLAVMDLEEALREVSPGSELVSFTAPSRVINYAEKNTPDVAFLDIEMGSMSGLVLAKELKDILPELHVIFVTSYEQYAIHAFQIHATGYLMKPVTAADIRRELTFIYGEAIEDYQKVQVQTFGGFAVRVNGELVEFKRSKSLELFAVLVDHRGAPITTREACALLWEDKPYDRAQKNYFQSLLLDLRMALREKGVEDVLVRKYNSLAVRVDRLDCDSYHFLDGDPRAVNSYRHDYLPSYSWAEFRIGEMERYLWK